MPGIVISILLIMLPLVLSGISVLLGKKRSLSLLLICLSIASLYFQAIPITGILLSRLVEYYPPISIENIDNIQPATPVAIVLIGGGRYTQAPEYANTDQVSNASFFRLLYAARAAKQYHLPIIVSGGTPSNETISEAEILNDALRYDFGVSSDILLETKSVNTLENAKFTAKLLKKHQINGPLLLVTHASHMPRSVNAFQKFGVNVIPAPVGFFNRQFIQHNVSFSNIKMYIPNTSRLMYNSLMLHEIVGRLWYIFR